MNSFIKMSFKVGQKISIKSECYKHTKRIISRDNIYWEFDPTDQTKCIFEYIITSVIDSKKGKSYIIQKCDTNTEDCEIYGIHICSSYPDNSFEICKIYLEQNNVAVLISINCESEWWVDLV